MTALGRHSLISTLREFGGELSGESGDLPACWQDEWKSKGSNRRSLRRLTNSVSLSRVIGSGQQCAEKTPLGDRRCCSGRARHSGSGNLAAAGSEVAVIADAANVTI